MSRSTCSRAYSGRHRDPKVDEKSSSGPKRKPHRVVPPTLDQYVDFLVHAAMRMPIAFNPQTLRNSPGPYAKALGKLLEDT